MHDPSSCGNLPTPARIGTVAAEAKPWSEAMSPLVRQAFAALRAGREAVLAQPLSAAFEADPQRFANFHAELDDLLFDYSKQRIAGETIAGLCGLAAAAEVEAKRDAM